MKNKKEGGLEETHHKEVKDGIRLYSEEGGFRT
jgi:hypothetical protein